MGSYKILRHVGNRTYELNLQNELVLLHPVFHVSIVKKCIKGPSTIVFIKGLEVKYNLAYQEVPVKILDHQVKSLRNKKLPS